jgi:heme A synthase
LTLVAQAPLALALMHQATAMIVLTVAVLHAQGMTAAQRTGSAGTSAEPADPLGGSTRLSMP